MEDWIQPVERTPARRLNPLLWGSVAVTLVWVVAIVTDELALLPLGRLPVMSLPFLTALIAAGLAVIVWRDHQVKLGLLNQAQHEIKRTDLLAERVAAARQRLRMVHRDDFGSPTRITG